MCELFKEFAFADLAKSNPTPQALAHESELSTAALAGHAQNFHQLGPARGDGQRVQQLDATEQSMALQGAPRICEIGQVILVDGACQDAVLKRCHSAPSFATEGRSIL
jgi:hypothetical protein